MRTILARASWMAAVSVAVLGCSDDPKDAAGDPDAGVSPDSGSGGADAGGSGGAPGSGGGGDAAPEGAADAGRTVVVTTTQGDVIGKVEGATRSFLGIPYAAPPTGANRFRPPQAPSPWTTPRDGTTPPRFCPQIALGSTTDVNPRSDEDCLTVNVWAPDPKPATPLPVMVWIHGGAFVFGSGADAFYDGRLLSEAGGVVVVTMNYRLGALGFLSHRDLAAESAAHPTSGNYGLLDQQAALRWVASEIGAFGGDAGEVTIFGESAGGFSVCAHMMMSGSRGLFHRAISQSGVCAGPAFGGELTVDQSFQKADAYATAMGCADPATAVDCLRGKPFEDLIAPIPGATQSPGGLFFQSSGQGGWFPLVDGDVLPAAGTTPSLAPVPLVLGSNADEGTLFPRPELFGGVPLADAAEYQAALERGFGTTKAALVLAEYPASAFPTANDAIIEVTGDGFFVCPARRFARQAEAAGSPVYLYSLEHAPEQPLIPDLGAFHSADLAFVFGIDPGIALTLPSEKPLVEMVQAYWTRFAKTSDPNGGGAPTWPLFTAAGDQSLSLDLPAAHAATGHQKARCDFWDGLQ